MSTCTRIYFQDGKHISFDDFNDVDALMKAAENKETVLIRTSFICPDVMINFGLVTFVEHFKDAHYITRDMAIRKYRGGAIVNGEETQH